MMTAQVSNMRGETRAEYFQIICNTSQTRTNHKQVTTLVKLRKKKLQSNHFPLFCTEKNPTILKIFQIVYTELNPTI